MSLGGVTGLFSLIVGVSFVSVALGSTNTAQIIKNIFDGFASSLKAAMGR